LYYFTHRSRRFSRLFLFALFPDLPRGPFLISAFPAMRQDSGEEAREPLSTTTRPHAQNVAKRSGSHITTQAPDENMAASHQGDGGKRCRDVRSVTQPTEWTKPVPG
jgi:hypothetical protein